MERRKGLKIIIIIAPEMNRLSAFCSKYFFLVRAYPWCNMNERAHTKMLRFNLEVELKKYIKRMGNKSFAEQ